MITSTGLSLVEKGGLQAWHSKASMHQLPAAALFLLLQEEHA
jgi:hypothetical protein